MFKWFEKRVDPYPEEGLNQPLPDHVLSVCMAGR